MQNMEEHENKNVATVLSVPIVTTTVTTTVAASIPASNSQNILPVLSNSAPLALQNTQQQQLQEQQEQPTQESHTNNENDNTMMIAEPSINIDMDCTKLNIAEQQQVQQLTAVVTPLPISWAMTATNNSLTETATTAAIKITATSALSSLVQPLEAPSSSSLSLSSVASSTSKIVLPSSLIVQQELLSTLPVPNIMSIKPSPQSTVSPFFFNINNNNNSNFNSNLTNVVAHSNTSLNNLSSSQFNLTSDLISLSSNALALVTTAPSAQSSSTLSSVSLPLSTSSSFVIQNSKVDVSFIGEQRKQQQQPQQTQFSLLSSNQSFIQAHSSSPSFYHQQLLSSKTTITTTTTITSTIAIIKTTTTTTTTAAATQLSSLSLNLSIRDTTAAFIENNSHEIESDFVAYESRIIDDTEKPSENQSIVEILGESLSTLKPTVGSNVNITNQRQHSQQPQQQHQQQQQIEHSNDLEDISLDDNGSNNDIEVGSNVVTKPQSPSPSPLQSQLQLLQQQQQLEYASVPSLDTSASGSGINTNRSTSVTNTALPLHYHRQQQQQQQLTEESKHRVLAYAQTRTDCYHYVQQQQQQQQQQPYHHQHQNHQSYNSYFVQASNPLTNCLPPYGGSNIRAASISTICIRHNNNTNGTNMFANTSATTDNSNGSNLLAQSANTAQHATVTATTTTPTTIGINSSANVLDDIGGVNSGAGSGDDRIKLLYPNVNEAETPLPRCWSAGEKCVSIALSQNNLRVQYKTPLLPNNKTQEPASVRTAHPIPPACGIYYFEVKIISKSKNGYMGIGLTAQQFRMNRLPGCDKQSFGYHGAEGNSFASSGHGQSYGPTFTTGDIIGCCVNFVNNTCFYTKNGIDLGIAFRDLPTKLYPTVGLQAPGEEVDVNFGQEPFKFDQIEEMMKQMRTEISATIYDFPLSPEQSDPIMLLQKLVSSYLVHNGYSDTAEAFSRCTGQTFREEISSIRNRQKILKLIMSGKMSQAIEHTLRSYPGLLENNKNLWFMLKCRQFIEMINGSDVEYCPNKTPTTSTTLINNNNNSSNNNSNNNNNKRNNGVNAGSGINVGSSSANHNSSSSDEEMNGVNSQLQQQQNDLLSTLMSPSSQSALPQQTSVIQSTKLYQNGGGSSSVDGSMSGDNQASSSNCHNSTGASTSKNQHDEIRGGNVMSSPPPPPHLSHPTQNIVEDISDIIMPITTTIAIVTATTVTTTAAATLTTTAATTTEASIITQTTLAATGANKCTNNSSNNNNSSINTTNGNANNDAQNSNYTAVINMDNILKSETNSDENVSISDDVRNNIANTKSNQCHKPDDIVNDDNDTIGLIDDDDVDHVDFYGDVEMDQTNTLPTNGNVCKNVADTNNFNDSTDNEEAMDVDVAVPPARKYKNGIERILEFGKDLSQMGQQLERENKMTDDDRQMLEDAFSLIAYSNPWSSPLGWQLCPTKRETVCTALNSAILESMYSPRRPPLDYCVAHANELLKVMAQASLGACAFVTINDVFPKD